MADEIPSEVESELLTWSRRGFLMRAGAAVAGTTILSQAACSSDPALLAKASQYPHLGTDYPVLEKLAPVVLGVDRDKRFVNTSDVPLYENLDRYFSNFDPITRGDLSKGIGLFNYAAIFIGFHFRPFVSLSDDAALAYANRWLNGNGIQRALISALKQLVFLSYWQDPSTWSAVEYDGPFTRPAGIARLGKAPVPS